MVLETALLLFEEQRCENNGVSVNNGNETEKDSLVVDETINQMNRFVLSLLP